MTRDPRWWWTFVGDLAVGHQGDVSPAYIEKVLTAIERLPDSLLSALHGAGVCVHLCRRLMDTWSGAPKYPPRGWGGAGWEEVGGCYRPTYRIVMVAEEVKRDGKWVKDDGDHTVLHELGHAMDHMLGRPSQHPEFRRAYLGARKAAIQAGHSEPLHYFVKHWAAGAIEVFADSVRLLYSPNLWDDDDLFRQHFGPCMELVAQRIQEVGG